MLISRAGISPSDNAFHFCISNPKLAKNKDNTAIREADPMSPRDYDFNKIVESRV